MCACVWVFVSVIFAWSVVEFVCVCSCELEEPFVRYCVLM